MHFRFALMHYDTTQEDAVLKAHGVTNYCSFTRYITMLLASALPTMFVTWKSLEGWRASLPVFAQSSSVFVAKTTNDAGFRSMPEALHFTIKNHWYCNMESVLVPPAFTSLVKPYQCHRELCGANEYAFKRF